MVPGNPAPSPWKKSPLSTERSSKQFNLSDNLPQTITPNISTHKIESAKTKQDKQQEFCIGILSSSPSVKFPLKSSPPGNIPPHGKFPSRKNICIFPHTKYWGFSPLLRKSGRFSQALSI